jgi:hypothetical protein
MGIADRHLRQTAGMGGTQQTAFSQNTNAALNDNEPGNSKCQHENG